MSFSDWGSPEYTWGDTGRKHTMFGKSKQGSGKPGAAAPGGSAMSVAGKAEGAAGPQISTGPIIAPSQANAPRVAEMMRRPFEHPEALRKEGEAASGGEGKKLIVGREICLSGEIKTCDQLVVEGRVEASLTDSRSLEISKTGFFKGSASIQDADISGRYEGDLTVAGCLKIRSGGSVEGDVSYGELEIERGGRITGNLARQGKESRKNARLTAADFVQSGGPENKPQNTLAKPDETGTIGSS